MSHRKLNENQVKEIIALYNDGYSYRKIAKIFNVSRHTICKINNKKLYKDIVEHRIFIKRYGLNKIKMS